MSSPSLVNCSIGLPYPHKFARTARKEIIRDGQTVKRADVFFSDEAGMSLLISRMRRMRIYMGGRNFCVRPDSEFTRHNNLPTRYTEFYRKWYSSCNSEEISVWDESLETFRLYQKDDFCKIPYFRDLINDKEAYPGSRPEDNDESVTPFREFFHTLVMLSDEHSVRYVENDTLPYHYQLNRTPNSVHGVNREGLPTHRGYRTPYTDSDVVSDVYATPVQSKYSSTEATIEHIYPAKYLSPTAQNDPNNWMVEISAANSLRNHMPLRYGDNPISPQDATPRERGGGGSAGEGPAEGDSAGGPWEVAGGQNRSNRGRPAVGVGGGGRRTGGSRSGGSAPPAAARLPAARPQTARPQTTRPQTTRPQTARPQTARPQTARPQTTRPQTARPQTARPQTAQPPAAGPPAAQPPARPQTAGPPAAQPPTKNTDTMVTLVKYSEGLNVVDIPQRDIRAILARKWLYTRITYVRLISKRSDGTQDPALWTNDKPGGAKFTPRETYLQRVFPEIVAAAKFGSELPDHGESEDDYFKSAKYNEGVKMFSSERNLNELLALICGWKNPLIPPTMGEYTEQELPTQVFKKKYLAGVRNANKLLNDERRLLEICFPNAPMSE